MFTDGKHLCVFLERLFASMGFLLHCLSVSVSAVFTTHVTAVRRPYASAVEGLLSSNTFNHSAKILANEAGVFVLTTNFRRRRLFNLPRPFILQQGSSTKPACQQQLR